MQGLGSKKLLKVMYAMTSDYPMTFDGFPGLMH